MTRNDIKHLKELRESERQYRPTSASIVFISLVYGWFILHYQAYFVGLLQPRLIGLPPELLGVPLIIFGLIQLFGMLFNCDIARRLSVIGLAFIWGGLFVVNFAYAFGDGYPNPIWLFMGKIIIDCIILATKGSYD
ncbi:MAG: hypothetical protein JJU16_05120 [Alkalibacterium sp.]|nr:hypothetical protein [Alkalibacterium sp.]